MLRTGNDSPKKAFTPLEIKPCRFKRRLPKGNLSLTGFTLIEVMVAAALLSLGAVLIYEAFFVSLDLFRYCSDYFNVAPWMDQKIWEVQDDLIRFGSSADIITNGTLYRKNKEFDWHLTYMMIAGGDEERLYKIDLVLFAKRGKKKVKLLRGAYAIAKLEQDGR